MRKRLNPRPPLLLAAALILLGGCASRGPDTPSLYDLGPLQTRASTALPALPPLSIASIATPSWLDSTLLFYRLSYDKPLQPSPYAHARWTMPPSQLLLQQLKSRISGAGGVALAASQGAANVPVLRIEADDFTQVFDSPSSSRGRVSLRASVFRGRTLLAHRAFVQEAPAPSADAAGGAAALAAAGDAAVADLITWLGTLDLK
ncbi:MAG TPA: ABC-type transport auxiliary lipoprotein family protein [Noviherbaspirillum sp.]|jgi:cholesterol transport system auxiliary component|uniref:ABC-type transport auxiliary lipoprotein family protein n=1 Tax=Noviherbaspirillum sp. TaxID=1926288 RepID=UPI002F92B682